jgi:hypothetical protein
MNLNLGKEQSALRRMSVGGRATPKCLARRRGRNKSWLLKRIVWRVQSLAECVLSERDRISNFAR